MLAGLKATIRAASAAKAQVSLTIAKERARLSVFSAFTPDLTPFGNPDSMFVRVEIGNDRATKAFDVEASIVCFTGEDRPISIPSRPFGHLVGVIGAEQSDTFASQDVLSCSAEDFKAVKNGTLKLWMHSVVSYVGIFNQRKTFANKFAFHLFPTATAPVVNWVPAEPTASVPEKDGPPLNIA
jgi:hypothetical protein